MFTIIGGDGREYGPVTAEQVRSWIAAGRADLNTKAKALGTDEWRTLGDFPEFSRPAAGDVPSRADGDAASIAAGLSARAGSLDPIACYEKSWNLLRGNFWPLLGATLLVIAMVLACSLISSVFGPVLEMVFGGVLTGGLQFYYLKKIRGEATDVSDVFSGFALALGPLVLAGLVVGLLVGLGFVLLVLPGVYLMVAYQFAYLLVIDRKLDFWTAMEVSRRIVTRQWWRVLALLLLGIPFMLLGLVCLLVGAFVSLVLIQGALVFAYREMCGAD